VSTAHESLTQQVDDRFDATVTRRWYRDPRRREYRDVEPILESVVGRNESE